MPEEVPENLATTEEKSPIPISSKAEKRSSILGRFNILGRFAEKRRAKEEAENLAKIQAGLVKDRNIVSSINQHQKFAVQPEDDVAALMAIDRLIKAGQATDQDIHKKAVIEATARANEQKRPLTENDVAEVEARLRSQTQKEPIPFQKPPETPQVSTEEEKVA